MKHRFFFASLGLAWVVALGQAAKPDIKHVMIEPATDETPRSDTAAIAPLADGRLMVVYNKFHRTKEAGRDHGLCTIWSKLSSDNGRTWDTPRMLVDSAEGDMNVQAPAIMRTRAGEIYLIALRAHKGGSSSTMLEVSFHLLSEEAINWSMITCAPLEKSPNCASHSSSMLG